MVVVEGFTEVLTLGLHPSDLLVSFNLWHKQFNHIKSNISLVLMYSGIVNGYQLLCDAHTVLEPHRVTAALFLF